MANEVAIIITTYRNPPALRRLLLNMVWAGLPDIPVYVFEDPSPFDDAESVHLQYIAITTEFNLPFYTAPEWGCMQGSIDFAFRSTKESWLIYVPDDVLFTKGSLWNEYAGVLTYGREFVGAIQAPYWNAHDLVDAGVFCDKAQMFVDLYPVGIPRNPQWDGAGVPRVYININGAGFSMNRRLFDLMGGWPKETWRLDEYAGFQAWNNDMVCITLPGPPRIHYFGGSTHIQPSGMDFHTTNAWEKATNGLTVEQAGNISRNKMALLPADEWNAILQHYDQHLPGYSLGEHKKVFYG